MKKNSVTIQSSNYKPHIKNVLLKCYQTEILQKRGPKHEIVFSKLIKEKCMSQMYEEVNVTDGMEILYKASKIICKDIENMKK